MRPARARLTAAALACAYTTAAAPADERWLEVRSPHFRVLSDAPEKDARAVATGFEELRKLFQYLGDLRVDPPVPIVVVATRNEDGLRALLPSRWERRGGMRIAGVFLPGLEKHYIALRLDVDAEFRDDVVYHEYVHSVVRLNFAAVPVWLNEGLAEFYAGTTVYDGAVLFGRVSDTRLEVLRERRPLPLEDLFAIDRTSREYNERSRASILYAQSALLTHFLMLGDEGARRKLLVEYLRLLGQGTAEPQARAQAFGDLKALEKDFFRYLRQKRFVFLSSPLARSDAPAAVRPLSEAEVLALRGEFHGRFGRAEDARPLLVRARDLDRKLAAAPYALGLLESWRNRFAEARLHFADAVRLSPDDFAAHYMWARNMPADAPDLPATEAALRRALELNPSFAPSHSVLAVVLRRQGHLDPALASIETACKLDPERMAYRVLRTDILREMNRPDTAEKTERELAQVIASDPTQAAALAEHYRLEGRPGEMERLLRRAADMDPRSVTVARMLASHLQRDGRADEAEAVYRRTLAVRPDDASLLNALAYLNADRNVKVAEALELIDRALKTYPTNSSFLDTKGWALFRRGRLDEAERFLRKSLKQRDDPDVLEHLGDVLAAQGHKATAQEMWKRALDHPESTDARKEELRRKLAAPVG
jgi:tetratricopeptide (TPR) repeat protein